MNLHEYLGMTWEEYSIWATRPSILAAIIQCRKKGISLKEELDQNDGGFLVQYIELD
jgi:hypothetical protein